MEAKRSTHDMCMKMLVSETPFSLPLTRTFMPQSASRLDRLLFYNHV
jgi:hypothetical protein